MSPRIEDITEKVNSSMEREMSQMLNDSRIRAKGRLLKALEKIGKMKNYTMVAKYLKEKNPFSSIYYIQYPPGPSESTILYALIILPDFVAWEKWENVNFLESIATLNPVDLISVVDQSSVYDLEGKTPELLYDQGLGRHLVYLKITRDEIPPKRDVTTILKGIEMLREACPEGE
ncbi:MAG: hypothetical protein AB9915_03735 [Candidatus Dojkabacteria bacterium]